MKKGEVNTSFYVGMSILVFMLVFFIILNQFAFQVLKSPYGSDCVDSDGDGFDDCYVGDEGDDGNVFDCDDSEILVNPGENEICDDGLDNDCDGEVDENCDVDDYDCEDGDTRECGIDIGNCEKGIETCVDGYWGDCEGSVGPSSEVCDDGLDNDCDGFVDEGCDASESYCGDGICDSDENCESCISDCSCFSYELCIKGVCESYSDSEYPLEDDELFIIDDSEEDVNYWLYILGILIPLLGGIFWFVLKKRKKNKKGKKVKNQKKKLNKR